MTDSTVKFWQPMTHPAVTQAKKPTAFVSAEGITITDDRGKTVIDAVGGLWNVNLGYSCQPVKDAITKQLNDMPYYSTFSGVTTDKALEAAEALVDWFAPEDIKRVFFTSGGSDSIESALRLSRQYHKIRGDKDRYKFISLKHGYHGTHFGGASVTGSTRFRRNYEPAMPGCFHITSPYTYRNMYNESDSETLANLCAIELEEMIKHQDPTTTAAFLMEPVLGSGGIIPPHSSFMPKVREICDRYGVLLIADEVITAFGRTGSWTGSRHWGVKPDIMTVAKGITNGFFPFGAALINSKVADVFEANSDSMGQISHGYTYSGHPVGAAAAMAVLNELKVNDVAQNSKARGEVLSAGFKRLFDRYEAIGDVRGVGLMQAIEVVADANTKAPADKEFMNKLGAAIYEAGVNVRISGNNMLISPSLIVTDADINAIISAIDFGFSKL